MSFVASMRDQAWGWAVLVSKILSYVSQLSFLFYILKKESSGNERRLALTGISLRRCQTSMNPDALFFLLVFFLLVCFYLFSFFP